MKRGAIGLAVVLALPNAVLAQATGVTLPFPPNSSGLICYQGQVYSLSSQQGTQFNYLPGGSTCTGNGANFTLTGGGATQAGSRGAYASVFGGPNSAQFQSLKTALDLATIDEEGEDRFLPEGDADTIGGAATYFDGKGFNGERAEGHYEKVWRPFEGQRTRAFVDVPVQATIVNGEVAGIGTLSGALELPVASNWSVTPRIGLGGAVSSSFYGKDGVVGTISVASRYKIAQVGRGDLVIGNLIAYTGESTTGNQNVAFRNGAAYQFPLKGRVFGRQTSVRFSYVNTYVAGDHVGISTIHEFALNFGVRLREQDVRNKFEALRFGVLYTLASHYNAATVTLGYRF